MKVTRCLLLHSSAIDEHGKELKSNSSKRELGGDNERGQVASTLTTRKCFLKERHFGSTTLNSFGVLVRPKKLNRESDHWGPP